MSPNWERVWRSAGIQFVVFFIVAFIIYGNQPKVGASHDKLISFYDGDRTRILIASIIFGFAILNLLWFGAALNSALRDAGQGGWGAAATAASTALGTIFFLLVTIGATLAYSVAGSGNDSLVSGLNDFTWVLTVVASFPAAMLVMASGFGLWRAGIISSSVLHRRRRGDRARAARRYDLGTRRLLGAGRRLQPLDHDDHRPRLAGLRQRAADDAQPEACARAGGCGDAVGES